VRCAALKISATAAGKARLSFADSELPEPAAELAFAAGGTFSGTAPLLSAAGWLHPLSSAIAAISATGIPDSKSLCVGTCLAE
jgi:hypothetical protein